MPHQQHIADVALEVDPETGLLAYRTVIVVGPRQVMGKTELMLPVMVHRAVGFGAQEPQEIRYAAQDGIEARRKWLDVHVPRLKDSPYRRQFHDRRRTSAEAIQWRNGSVHAPIAGGTRKSGTSDSIDLAVIDEAWVHDDTRIEQGLRPTMLTRTQPQLWVVSMVPGPSRAKTTKSTYLRGKMAAGRQLVESGVRQGVAYFEYSAPARDAHGRKIDPADPATWLSCMPALCPDGPPCRCDPAGLWQHTTFLPAVHDDHQALDNHLDFTSEYLGWWPDETATGWRVITEQQWDATKRPEAKMRPPLALCAWVAPDRSWAAIGSAGYREGGRLVEITGDKHGVDYRQGAGWVLPRLRELDERHEPVAIVTNDRSLADQAGDAGVPLHRLQAGDEASAAGMLFDGLAGDDAAARDVRHLGQRALTSAMAAVVKRSQGQWWVWDRAVPQDDIAPVPAVGGALWALMTPRVHIERTRALAPARVRWM